MPQKGLGASFTQYLRKYHRPRCPVEGCKEHRINSDEPIRTHLRKSQSSYAHDNENLLVEDIKYLHLVATSEIPIPATLRKPDDETLLDIEELSICKDLGGQIKTRRGRGTRRNAAYWKGWNNDPNADPFDERELLFSDAYGGLKVSRLANLDTQLKIHNGGRDDLIMSSHCARELGVLGQMSTDFEDPCLQSISGHSTVVNGILRNVQFRLKGSSITFCRSFWVCDAIDGIVDVMIGASFIKDNFRMLFEKVKECVSSFATWFSKKKETPEQKREREEQERQQKIKVHELEIKRLQRESAMHQRANDRDSNGSGSVHQSST